MSNSEMIKALWLAKRALERSKPTMIYPELHEMHDAALKAVTEALQNTHEPIVKKY